LVIANATSPRNVEGNWIPAVPAFSSEEVQAIREWVSGGGSLFLIADHLPYGGPSASLAAAFGVLFAEGYATDQTCGADEFLFETPTGLLKEHPITRGRNRNERVTAVRTITGQAFRAVAPVKPLLVLAPGSVILLPMEPWQFTKTTPRVPGEGMLQGAVLTHGTGRVAVFGEAAMFSAQVSGAARRPMGMNMSNASQNAQFLLNIVHWLAGLLPKE
jgi:hypothetical protein